MENKIILNKKISMDRGPMQFKLLFGQTPK